MTTKHKPTRKQTDAEMGALIRRSFSTFVFTYPLSVLHDRRKYSVLDATGITAARNLSKSNATLFARLANRMAQEDKEKRG